MAYTTTTKKSINKSGVREIREPQRSSSKGTIRQ